MLTTTHKLTADEADRIKHALLVRSESAGPASSFARELISAFALVDAATAPAAAQSGERESEAPVQP